jgi:hypothetical protein
VAHTDRCSNDIVSSDAEHRWRIEHMCQNPNTMPMDRPLVMELAVAMGVGEEDVVVDDDMMIDTTGVGGLVVVVDD